LKPGDPLFRRLASLVQRKPKTRLAFQLLNEFRDRNRRGVSDQQMDVIVTPRLALLRFLLLLVIVRAERDEFGALLLADFAKQGFQLFLAFRGDKPLAPVSDENEVRVQLMKRMRAVADSLSLHVPTISARMVSNSLKR